VALAALRDALELRVRARQRARRDQVADVPVERLENNVVYLFGKPNRLD